MMAPLHQARQIKDTQVATTSTTHQTIQEQVAELAVQELLPITSMEPLVALDGQAQLLERQLLELAVELALGKAL
jgi:hypothetical protein